MADVQITAPGVKAAPLDYVVPGSQEIILKSLFATFDGTASATSFLPAVQLIAPGGRVAGTYVTQSSVAAGGSADVSFGPFLRGATAATPATAASLPLAMAADDSTTLTSGTTITMSFADWFGTTDSATFSTRVVGGKTYVNVKRSGIYSLQIACIAQMPAVTGPLVIGSFFDSPSATVDTTEFDVGRLIDGTVTSGGANHWQATTNTYFGLPSPAGAAFTAHIGTVGLSGNITNQRTDLVMVRIADYVANVFL